MRCELVLLLLFALVWRTTSGSFYAFDAHVSGNFSVSGKFEMETELQIGQIQYSLPSAAPQPGQVLVAETGTNIPLVWKDITLNSVGSSVSLVKSPTGPDFQLYGLKGGTAIDISQPTNGDITISNTMSLSTASGSSGTSLLSGSSPSYQLAGLKAGTGIELSGPTSGDVTIASSVTLATAGTGNSLVNTGSGAALTVLGLLAGTGISLTRGTTDITIASSISQVSLSAASGSSGTSLLSGSSPSYQLAGLKAGTGIELSGPTSGDVTIASSVTLASAGTGNSLVNTGSGAALTVLGLIAGTGISLTRGTTDITITSDVSCSCSALDSWPIGSVFFTLDLTTDPNSLVGGTWTFYSGCIDYILVYFVVDLLECQTAIYYWQRTA